MCEMCSKEKNNSKLKLRIEFYGHEKITAAVKGKCRHRSIETT